MLDHNWWNRTGEEVNGISGARQGVGGVFEVEMPFWKVFLIVSDDFSFITERGTRWLRQAMAGSPKQ